MSVRSVCAFLTASTCLFVHNPFASMSTMSSRKLYNIMFQGSRKKNDAEIAKAYFPSFDYSRT